MNSAIYAFILNGSDWRKAMPDDWDLVPVEIDGSEQILGHLKIDGAICKILKNAEGKVIAVTK